MRIVESTDDKPAGRCAGAGVLGFCSPTPGGDVFFVLGKERECANWRYGSNRWSDFAGAGKDAEEPEMTAAREFAEETLAVVPWEAQSSENEALSAVLDVEGAAASLRRGEFSIKVVISIHGNDTDPKHHVTYVKRVPWCPQAPGEFHDLRGELLRLQVARDMAVEAMGSAYDGLRADGVALPDLPYPRPERASILGDGRLELRGWWRGAGGAPDDDPRAICVRASPASAAALVAAVQRWDDVIAQLQGLPQRTREHPAVAVTRAPNGTPLTVDVSTDYLEKQSMQLWSRSRLEEVVRGAGYFRGDHFRPCFLPTLAVVLDCFGKEGLLLAAAARKDANLHVRSLGGAHEQQQQRPPRRACLAHRVVDPRSTYAEVAATAGSTEEEEEEQKHRILFVD